MTYFTIKIQTAPVTVNLTSFTGLNKANIQWGDGTTTNNTFSHTYNTAGKYTIIGNFEEVIKIENNFTINNLLFIDFTNFEALQQIGNNFLNNCNKIKYLVLSPLNIDSIGSSFLNGCTNIEILKLPKNVPGLTSWGSNVASNVTKLKIYYDHQSKYTEDTIWNGLAKAQWIAEECIYHENVDKATIQNISFRNNIFTTKILNLNTFTNIKNAINNHNIYVEENLPELVDPKTRRVYNDETLAKKCIFILEYTLHFKENPNILGSPEYTPVYTRIVKALRTETINGVTFLYLQDLSNKVFFYLKDTELENVNVTKKYSIKDVLINETTKVLQYDTKVFSYYDENNNVVGEYEDPPYFRGTIVFGIINNENATNALYEGDISTGFDIEIKARGTCKNLIIYDLDINQELGRREYIKINTDKFPEGKIIAGDYILIRTKQGVKSAILERHGETIDIMKYLDRTSSWLQIHKGDNYFYADADQGEGNGSIYNVKINLVWNDLYEGV